MPERNRPQPAEIALPYQVSLADRFWIDPAEIGSVKDIINRTHLSTMALGVKSRQDESPEIRAALEEALTGPEDPLYGEQRRALNVGFLYGSLLTRGKGDEATEAELPGGFTDGLAAVKDGLDLSSDHDNFLFFMRLRDLEVEMTGSDLLAFCLASTQDHMARLFSANHKGEEELTARDITRMQTLYYAGALAGALANTQEELPKTGVQIMRGRRDPVEQISLRQAYDFDTDLQESINYRLRSKYDFSPTERGGRPVIAVLPGGLQFGPNALSMPIYAPGLIDLAETSAIPIDKIDAVILESGYKDDQPNARMRIEKDVKGFLEENAELPFKNQETIRGIIAGDHCISAIDIAHPWALAVDQLIRGQMGIQPGGVKYSNELQLWSEMNIERRVSLMNKLALGTIIAFAWTPMPPEFELNVPQGITVTALGIGMLGLGRYLRQRIDRHYSTQTERYDRIWQAHLDQQTLHNPKNSGSIAN